MYSGFARLFAAILLSLPAFDEGLPAIRNTWSKIKTDNSAEMRSLTSEEITCWTCAEKTGNEACNNWAPELRCPLGHSVCKTVHRFDEITMETVSLSKMCSLPEMCSNTQIGCRRVQAEENECISCCTESYCNEDIAHDQVSAVSLSLKSLNAATNRVSLSHQLSVISWFIFKISSVY